MATACSGTSLGGPAVASVRVKPGPTPLTLCGFVKISWANLKPPVIVYSLNIPETLKGQSKLPKL